MAKPAFCSCMDHACKQNPVNHERGCEPCVAKCLQAGEIPSCFFHKLKVPVDDGDYSFAGFARRALPRSD